MVRPALKLIESNTFFEERGEFWVTDRGDTHSLHSSALYKDSFSSGLPGFFISKYSKPGQVVLDPFCGRGTTPLEAGFNGRIAFASDSNPTAKALTLGKLFPRDLAEVTLFLQGVNFNLPVSLEHYQEFFEPFYDYQTYREIVNLKRHLQKCSDEVGTFVRFVAISLLHGHTAGYLSTYTLPHVSLSPSAQLELNNRRGQTPDYRAVAARIIRKTAMIMRDGGISALDKMQKLFRVEQSDARDLKWCRSASVDLVVTAPPRPGNNNISDFWLENWFLGVNPKTLQDSNFSSSTMSEWSSFMNETLLEMSRVVKSGGRGVLDLRAISGPKGTIELDSIIAKDVEENLSRYWDLEGLYIHQPRLPRLRHREVSEKDNRLSQNQHRVLVLRRR